MVVAWEQSHMHVRGTTCFISLWGVHLNLVFPFLLCDRRKGNKIIRTHHHMGRTWLVLEKSSNKIFTTEHLCWGRYHYLIWKYVPNIEEINHLLVWFSFLVNHFWTIRACDLSVHITCLEEKRNIMFFQKYGLYGLKSSTLADWGYVLPFSFLLFSFPWTIELYVPDSRWPGWCTPWRH